MHEVKSESEVAQSCPTLHDPMDRSLPGSSVQGIFQARILEWVAISCSGDLPNPGIEPMSLASPTLQANSFTAEPPGEPLVIYIVTRMDLKNTMLS